MREKYRRGRTFWLCFLLTVTFGIPRLSDAATFYVSKSGNDSLNGLFPVFSSGYDGPKLTLGGAYLLAQPGDTIVAGQGYYDESLQIGQDLVLVTDSVYLRKLTMDGVSVILTLSGDTLCIRDTLELLNGIIRPESGFYFFCPFPAEIAGGNNGSYVDGRLYRQVGNGAGVLFYPIGVLGDYRPAEMNYNQNIPDSRVHWMQVYQGSAPVSNGLPTGIRNISNRHYWEFGRLDSGVHTDYIFQLNYDSLVTNDHVYEPLELRMLLSVNGGAWLNIGGAGDFEKRGKIRAALAADTTGYLTLSNTTPGFNPLGSILPFAAFSHTGTCAKQTFTFQDASFNLAPAAITSWRWDFGDPAVKSDTTMNPNPVYTYPVAGIYKVSLIVTNDSSLTDTAEWMVEVKPLPKVAFSSDSVCYGRPTAFIDNTIVAAPDSVQFRRWTFGDGAKDSFRSGSHNYASAGIFPAKLAAITAYGCADSFSRSVVVHGVARPVFTAGEVCSGMFSQFRRTISQSPPENEIEYRWYDNYRDLATDTIYNGILSPDGAHRITLVAETKNGCQDSMVQTEMVYGKPTGYLYLNSAVPGNDSIQCLTTNQFTLHAGAAAPHSQVVSASLFWGDGFAGTLADTIHSYSAEGLYRVKLILNTDKGCRDSLFGEYVVRGRVVPNFTKSGFCTPDSILFIDSGTVSTSAVVNYQWNFPDGTDFGSSLRRFVLQAGSYDMTLIATNAEGCQDSVRRSFVFYPLPVVTFNFTGSLPFCPGDSAALQTGGGWQMRWLLDNDSNRIRTVYTAGFYSVEASNGPQCKATDSFQVLVYPVADIRAGRDTTILVGERAILRASGGNTYQWTPAATLSSATGSPVVASPLSDQLYVVQGTTVNGCIGYDSIMVYVADREMIRIPNLISPNGDGKNDFWVLSDLRDLSSFTVTITDYAGKVLMTTPDYKNDWNAESGGEKLPEGTYFFLLENRVTGKMHKGFIQVIR